MNAPIHRASLTPSDGTDTRSARAFIARDNRSNGLLAHDPASPEFAEEARRQGLALANSPTEEEDQAFVDSISIWPGDD